MLEDNTKARCKICGTILKAHIKSIKGHVEGKKHKENSAHSSLSQTSIVDSLPQKEQSSPPSTEQEHSPNTSEQAVSEEMQNEDMSDHRPSLMSERLRYDITDDEFNIAGKHIASKLKVLSWDQKLYAERLINEVLFEAQLGNLSRDCKLVTQKSSQNPTFADLQPVSDKVTGVQRVCDPSQTNNISFVTKIL